MSLKASIWAAQQSVGSPTAKYVLLMLAQYADEEGACFPGQGTLADACELHERIIRKWLSFLQGKGFIRRERRQRKDGLRSSDQIILAIDLPAQEAASQPAPKAGTEANRLLEPVTLPAFKADLTGSRSRALICKDNLSDIYNKGSARACAHEDRTPDEWWSEFKSAYPKREGSNPWKPAREKFMKAIARGINPATMVEGAKAYAEAYPEPTPYIAQAVTWINQERWNDDVPSRPIPVRANGHTKPMNRSERTLDVFANLIKRYEANGTG